MLEAKLADPALARYRPWLRDLRVFRPHQLSDDLEKLTHERDLTASAAWVRLFDETVAAMRIDCNGETLTVSDTLNRLSDRDRTVRETAGKAVGKDQDQGKATLVSIHGVDGAQAQAEALARSAAEAVSIYGPVGEPLAALPYYLIGRAS